MGKGRAGTLYPATLTSRGSRTVWNSWKRLLGVFQAVSELMGWFGSGVTHSLSITTRGRDSIPEMEW